MKKLNIEENKHYECIISTKSKLGKYNAASMGIKFLKSSEILIEPHLTTKTYQNIKDTNLALINITCDGKKFVKSMLNKLDLKYNKEFDMPTTLAESYGYVKIKLKKYRILEKKDEIGTSKYAKMYFKIEKYRLKKRAPNLFSRANNALVESSIILSKNKLDKNLNYFKEVISKTGTDEKELLKKLIDDI